MLKVLKLLVVLYSLLFLFFWGLIQNENISKSVSMRRTKYITANVFTSLKSIEYLPFEAFKESEQGGGYVYVVNFDEGNGAWEVKNIPINTQKVQSAKGVLITSDLHSLTIGPLGIIRSTPQGTKVVVDGDVFDKGEGGTYPLGLVDELVLGGHDIWIIGAAVGDETSIAYWLKLAYQFNSQNIVADLDVKLSDIEQKIRSIFGTSDYRKFWKNIFVKLTVDKNILKEEIEKLYQDGNILNDSIQLTKEEKGILDEMKARLSQSKKLRNLVVQMLKDKEAQTYKILNVNGFKVLITHACIPLTNDGKLYSLNGLSGKALFAYIENKLKEFKHAYLKGKGEEWNLKNPDFLKYLGLSVFSPSQGTGSIDDWKRYIGEKVSAHNSLSLFLTSQPEVNDETKYNLKQLVSNAGVEVAGMFSGNKLTEIGNRRIAEALGRIFGVDMIVFGHWENEKGKVRVVSSGKVVYIDGKFTSSSKDLNFSETGAGIFITDEGIPYTLHLLTIKDILSQDYHNQEIKKIVRENLRLKDVFYYNLSIPGSEISEYPIIEKEFKKYFPRDIPPQGVLDKKTIEELSETDKQQILSHPTRIILPAVFEKIGEQ